MRIRLDISPGYTLARTTGWPGMASKQNQMELCVSLYYLNQPVLSAQSLNDEQSDGLAAYRSPHGGGRRGHGVPLWQTPYPSAAIQSLLPRNSQPYQRSIT